jgi:hypothetical protein
MPGQEEVCLILGTRTYRAPVKIYWKSLQIQIGQEIAAQGKV